jgi:hypothetical protein
MAAFVLAGASASVAEAEVLSRDEYVNPLEGKCKPGAETTRRAMKGVRDDVRHRQRIPIAARKFGRAAHIFGGTIKHIDRVSRPPGDAGRLKEWFVYLKRQEAYLKRIAAQLLIKHSIKAQRLTARFIHNVTLAFGSDYCNFKFSRYG